MKNIEEIRQEIIKGTLAPNDYIELKKSVPKDISQIVRIIIGMTNTKGGFILFGISFHNNKNYLFKIDVKDVITKIEGLKDYCSKIVIKTGTINIKKGCIPYIQVDSSPYPVYFQKNDNSRWLSLFIREQHKTKVKESNEWLNGSLCYKYLYKYLNLDAFICSLYNRSLRFSEPSEWPDKYETRFYCADYRNVKGKESATKIYASCFSRSKNCEAAWKVYARNYGIKSRCIQLEINIIELRKQLTLASYIREERKMNYVSEDYILNLHKKASQDYSKYFNPLKQESFLNLLALKREAYSYENEVRIFFIPIKGINTIDTSSSNKYKDIPINWDKIIKSVRFDKKCSNGELFAIAQACSHAKINPIFKNVDSPIPVTLNDSFENIDFFAYDIDSLPDIKNITIE